MKTKTHHENEDTSQKRRHITKTKTHHENEDTSRKWRHITKTKTHHENEDTSRKWRPLLKRRHITKTSSKEVGITFEDKDFVYETHYENEDPYGNLEFWIWYVCNLLRNISTVEPHGAFMEPGTAFKLKRDLIEKTRLAYGRYVAWRFKR